MTSKTVKTSFRQQRVRNVCARDTRTPSTRAARARALFLKNLVLHANTRAHPCARAVLKIMLFLGVLIFNRHNFHSNLNTSKIISKFHSISTVFLIFLP